MTHVQPWLLVTVIVCFYYNLNAYLTLKHKLETELKVEYKGIVFVILLICDLVRFYHVTLIIVYHTISIWRLCTWISHSQVALTICRQLDYSQVRYVDIYLIPWNKVTHIIESKSYWIPKLASDQKYILGYWVYLSYLFVL